MCDLGFVWVIGPLPCCSGDKYDQCSVLYGSRLHEQLRLYIPKPINQTSDQGWDLDKPICRIGNPTISDLRSEMRLQQLLPATGGQRHSWWYGIGGKGQVTSNQMRLRFHCSTPLSGVCDSLFVWWWFLTLHFRNVITAIGYCHLSVFWPICITLAPPSGLRFAYKNTYLAVEIIWETCHTAEYR